MSLFGAKRSAISLKDSLARAKENLQRRETVSPSVASEESSHIGGLLDKITGPVMVSDEDGATNPEVAREEKEFFGTAEYERLKAEEKNDEFEYGLHKARIEDDLRRAEGSQATSRVDTGQLPSDINDMRTYSDLTGKTGVTGITRYGSDDSSELSTPPATTNYGGSEISFPSQTPRERVATPLPSTNYEGSLKGLPLSALNALTEDPFSTPRASAGIIACKYIQSEENTSQYTEEEGGMEETRKVYTPIPRKFEISDSSENEDDMMTEVEWRDEEVYMTPTKKGKKRNKGKGVQRLATPERPILNMPQTPNRRKLEADWARPAESLTNENEPADLGKFIGEYLRNTNGLRDFMVGQERNDANYDIWCQQQSQHIAARQNHTDAAVMSVREIAQNVRTEMEAERVYAAERAEKLDDRLSKIEKKLAKIALVNMAKTIENAMRDCMGKMIDQLTDRVVKRFEDAAEESSKKEEIRRGKQVEATPEEKEMSDIEFEPGAAFSEEENRKVAEVIERMQVDEQELEVSRHTPSIPPGETRQEFPRFAPSGQVTIAKTPVVPAVPEQKKKEVKKPEVKETPKGPKAGEKKKPEVKKPEQQQPAKKPAEKKKETWAQRAAAPPPPKKQPEQRQQQ